MRTRRVMGMAWTNLRRRKVRAALTALGIVVGIMAMVSISALGGGFEGAITGQLTVGLETDILTVMPSGGLFGSGLKYVTENESQYIANLTGVVATMPMMQRTTVLYNHANDTLATRMVGVNFTQLWQIYSHRLHFTAGGLPDPSVNNTAILGYLSTPFAQVGDNISVQLLVQTGYSLTSKNYTFTVSGLLDKSGYSGFMPFDRTLFVHLNTSETIFQTDQLDVITVKIASPSQADSIAEEIRKYYDNQVMVLVSSSLISTVQSIFSLVEVFLLAIASIALVVAGISILNIMLVSVLERTREIGIMKALGSKSRTILGQFLAEAALLGLLGGAIGIVGGWFLAYGMGQLLPLLFSSGMSTGGMGSTFGGSMGSFESFQGLVIVPRLTINNILIAFLFAVLVSVVFALYPARKAAKLNPVQALRYE
jgi:putative ABC transport system permease protein